MTLRLNDEDLEKLEQLAEREYKRRGDKTKVLRWIIQDMWEDKCKEKEVA